MNIIRGLDFSVNFYVMGKKNHMKNLKSIHRMVVKKINQTGFDIVPSFYNSKHHLLLCPGHNNAYIRTRGISKISMNGFESKWVFLKIYINASCISVFILSFIFLKVEFCCTFVSGKKYFKKFTIKWKEIFHGKIAQFSQDVNDSHKIINSMHKMILALNSHSVVQV